ncbi:hypothetical protein MRX96_001464 [Rhipicephalus microplus]
MYPSTYGINVMVKLFALLLVFAMYLVSPVVDAGGVSYIGSGYGGLGYGAGGYGGLGYGGLNGAGLGVVGLGGVGLNAAGLGGVGLLGAGLGGAGLGGVGLAGAGLGGAGLGGVGVGSSVALLSGGTRLRQAGSWASFCCQNRSPRQQSQCWRSPPRPLRPGKWIRTWWLWGAMEDTADMATKANFGVH